MAFKTLMKRQLRMMPPKTVKFLANGTTIVSKDLKKLFGDNNFVEVMIDEDYNKIALKPSSDSIRGYALSDSSTFQCSLLRKGGIKGEFKVRFTEGKIIIDKIDIKRLKDMEYWVD